VLTCCPFPSPHRVFSFHTHITMDWRQTTRHSMLRSLPSARIAYATAAASLLPTATNHMTPQAYWRSSASVISSAQRYSLGKSADAVLTYLRSISMFADETTKVVKRERCIFRRFDNVLRQIAAGEALVCQANLVPITTLPCNNITNM